MLEEKKKKKKRGLTAVLLELDMKTAPGWFSALFTGHFCPSCSSVDASG